MAQGSPSVMRVTGWRCRVCGDTADIATTGPWRCPKSTSGDRLHSLAIVQGAPALRIAGEVNPFIVHDGDLAWAAHAQAHGMDFGARCALVGEVDDSIRAVAGIGFAPTPFGRSAALSDALGFTGDGGVWVKDETGGVGGSQKARHLFSILLHLLAAERLGLLPQRQPLAIASCGNAALAAATLAAAADWPIDVYVPTWMSDAFGSELDRLGARVHRCERRDNDPAGDPAMFRFREAVADGAVPFTVQGSENALALDGGRTIGWEIGEQFAEVGAGDLDRVYVQVGGGAFAACLGSGLRDNTDGVRLIAVQAQGCAPLARAWQRAGGDVQRGTGALGGRWSELMTPWDNPQSLADGILDDETYDWLGVFDAIGPRGDAPVVAPEGDIVAAHRMAREAGFDVSPTGSAGLAGLISTLDGVDPAEHVAVVMSGLAR